MINQDTRNIARKNTKKYEKQDCVNQHECYTYIHKYEIYTSHQLTILQDLFDDSSYSFAKFVTTAL